MAALGFIVQVAQRVASGVTVVLGLSLRLRPSLLISLWNSEPKMAGEIASHLKPQAFSNFSRMSRVNAGRGSVSANRSPLI